MAEHEYASNIGTWAFHSLIESAKLDRMTRNEQSTHENKTRLNRQFESSYSDASGYGTVNDFEPDHSCLLWGVRAVGPPELTGQRIVTVELTYPTGAGLPPFLRAPVAVCSTVAYYVPSASSGEGWQTADLSAAVDLIGLDDWLLCGLAKPSAALNSLRSGMALALRSAGFMFDGFTPTAAANFPANAWVYIFFHVAGAVAAY